MKLLVTDTNIFIDLIRLGKCEEFFELNMDIHTTQFVCHELNSKQKEELKSYIDNEKLNVKSFTVVEMTEIEEMDISRSSVAKRIADRSVLYYAEKMNGILVTGDKKLKNEAKDRGLKTCGTIWIIDQLYYQGLIGLRETVDLLESIKDINPFLPKEEINLILKKIEAT